MALTESQKRNAKKNLRYWKEREDEALKHYIKEEEEYDRQIKRIYSDMLDSCNEQINAFYGRYADKEGITLAEAKKRVKGLEIEKYERKAAKYVKEKDFSDKANEEMRLYNATMKINRLEMLKANIGLELISGHAELEKFMAGILKGRTEAELARQAGILGKTIRNNAQLAHAIPNASFHNATFSDRIWQYQDLMREELSRQLQIGLIQGKNPRAIAKSLQKYWYGNDPATGGGAVYCMERLMRTELARVQTEAQKQSFERNGFTKYEFIANHNCCSICKEKDGKPFNVKDMMPGTNAAPMHPHCRCSTAAYEDSEEYEAWLDHLNKGGTTAEWNKFKKKLDNSGKSGIMSSKSFNTTDDPMREVTGAGLKSHPAEVKAMQDDMEAAGVEIDYRDNAMAYSPSVISGRPGKLIIDKEASYSAWSHEYTHFLDDKNDGYIGMRIFADTEKCIERERHAYNVEIQMAKQLNRPDIVKRLEELMRKEIARYEDTTE